MNGAEYIPEDQRERAVISEEAPDNGERVYGGAAIKIWHDDVRPAPDGWVWAKTNKLAIEMLRRHSVAEISLDHDLGAIPTGEEDPTEVLYLRGTGEETGLHLVEWMIEFDCVPPVVRIHSWNSVGAKRMAAALADAGHSCVVAPFIPPKPAGHSKGCLCDPCREHGFMSGDHV